MLKCKSGFTLAEVLITLGVIGVVAAMTLPTLIQKHQNQVYVTQLKKFVSTFEQGMQLAMTEDGVDNLANTSLFNKVQHVDWLCSSVEGCGEFFPELKKYMKLDLNATYDASNSVYLGGDILMKNWEPILEENVPSLHDGAQLIGFYIFKNGTANLTVDINGQKGPNRMGRDIYQFLLQANGRFEVTDSWKQQSICDLTSFGSYTGSGCYSRIVQNGWKMDY